jgi:hypothetical protein
MGVALENIRREKVWDSRDLGESREELKHFAGSWGLRRAHPYKRRVGHPQVLVSVLVRIVVVRNALVGNAFRSCRDGVASWKNPPLKSRGGIPEEAVRRGTIQGKSALTFALVPEHVLGGLLCRSYEKIR